jgi:DNA-binding PadR family transcriptional regulator
VQSFPSKVMSPLEFQVLLTLAEGPAHGYAIGRDLQERSEGRVDPTTGALYHILRRLEDAGLVEPAPDALGPGEDARRRYFRITATGRRAAKEEAAYLESLVATARERRVLGARP